MSAPGQLAGTRIAGFLLESLVGRGGMGEVYRSHDASLDRAVAVKVVVPEGADDERFAQRAVAESLRAASIEHPNVIPIYEAGRDGDRVFIAMRYVAGGDLRALLRRDGHLPPSRALPLLAQIASALDAAHARGLVHRDVKPSNILIDNQGGKEHPYLGDFGLTVGPDGGAAQSAAGVSLGTIAYVAPEQIRGDAISGRADQYALACVLFECLSGSLPFRDESELAVLFAHLEQPPPRLSDRRAELPSAVDSVIGRGLAKAPGDRFETCRELIAQTQAALAPAAKRRRVRAAVIAAIAAAALGVVGLPLVFTGGSDPRPRTGYLERIDPASGDVNATYPLSEHPGRIAASGGRVWTVDLREGALWRLDAARGDLLRLPSVGNPRDVAILGGDAYVADDSFATFSGNVTRYDAATGQRKGGLALLACAIAAGDRVVWAAGCPNIERLDFSGTGVRVVARQEIPLPRARSAGHDRTLLQDMAIGEGALWVLGDATDPRVWKIERATGRILATTALPFAPRSIAAGAGGVWISGGIADVVARLDPRDGRLLTLIHVGRGASGVTTGAGRVWVATALDGAVSEIDAVTSRVVRTIHVGGLPRELAYAEHALWVAGDAR
jgi:serine/threonine-protein kinase